jgi:hypothetical protein
MDFEYTREIDVIEHNKSNGRMFEYCSWYHISIEITTNKHSWYPKMSEKTYPLTEECYTRLYET